MFFSKTPLMVRLLFVFVLSLLSLSEVHSQMDAQTIAALEELEKTFVMIRQQNRQQFPLLSDSIKVNPTLDANKIGGEQLKFVLKSYLSHIETVQGSYADLFNKFSEIFKIPSLIGKAKRGDAESLFGLGLFSFLGFFSPSHKPDDNLAQVFFKKASELGHTKASYYAGQFYVYAGDFEKAAKAFDFAAKNGELRAQRRSEGLKNYQIQRTSVSKDNPEAIAQLAHTYINGVYSISDYFPETNWNAAHQYFEMAAKKDPRYYGYVAYCDDMMGRRKEAVKFSKKAIEVFEKQGNPDPEQKLKLSFNYSYSGEKERAFRTVEELCRTADWRNYNYATQKNWDVPHTIARYYHYGFGVPPNADSAIKYYHEAIGLGCEAANESLAKLYDQMQPSRKDSAVKYMEAGLRVMSSRTPLWWLINNHPVSLNRFEGLFAKTDDFTELQQAINKQSGVTVLFGWKSLGTNDQGNYTMPYTLNQYYVLNKFCEKTKTRIYNFTFDAPQFLSYADALTDLLQLKMPFFYLTGIPEDHIITFGQTPLSVQYFNRLQPGWAGVFPVVWVYKNGSLLKFQRGVDDALLNYIESVSKF